MMNLKNANMHGPLWCGGFTLGERTRDEGLLLQPVRHEQKLSVGLKNNHVLPSLHPSRSRVTTFLS